MGENRGLAGQSWTPSPPQRLAGSPPCRPSNEIRGTGGGRQFGGRKNGKWPNRRHAHPIASLPLQLPVLCRPAACFALKTVLSSLPSEKKKPPLCPSPVASDLVPRCQADPQGIHRIIASTRRKNKRLTRPRLQHPIHQSPFDAHPDPSPRIAVSFGPASAAHSPPSASPWVIRASAPVCCAPHHSPGPVSIVGQRDSGLQRCCCCMLHDSATNQRR